MKNKSSDEMKLDYIRNRVESLPTPDLSSKNGRELFFDEMCNIICDIKTVFGPLLYSKELNKYKNL